MIGCRHSQFLAVLCFSLSSFLIAQTPSKAVITGDGTPTLTITNASAVTLSAYVYTKTESVAQQDGRTLKVTSDWFVDNTRTPSRGILPGAQKTILAGGENGSPELTFRAAVFSDGSTFGNPEYVKQILDRRRYDLEGLTTVMTILDQAIAAHASIDDVLRQLTSAKANAEQSLSDRIHRGSVSGALTAAAQYLARFSTGGSNSADSALPLKRLEQHLNKRADVLRTALPAVSN